MEDRTDRRQLIEHIIEVESGGEEHTATLRVTAAEVNGPATQRAVLALEPVPRILTVMAKRVITQMTDDLDPTQAAEKTIQFGLEGVT